MHHARFALVLTLLLAASCSGSPATDTCASPSTSELAASSTIEMSLRPNPVVAGTRATLSMDPDGDFAGEFVGIGAEFQCWDGVEWKPLFLLTRDKPELSPSTVPVVPGQTTALPAIGIPLPDSSDVLIPDVPPGIYRIEDHIEDSTITGFAIVQVTARN
ncbi:hypothetical protein BMS3Abin02_01936 [bacterium BMS3Abin02]|nr:hypothetical protein BMS3Abin02_01936 [bacterium BMS3Abin02]HDL48486.1 hypothetical protein [Actinomycetota bacterium]